MHPTTLLHWLTAVLEPALVALQTSARTRHRQDTNALRRQQLQEPRTSLTQAYQLLREPQGQPLIFLRDDHGQLQSHPQTVHWLFTQRWQRICAGTPLLDSPDHTTYTSLYEPFVASESQTAQFEGLAAPLTASDLLSTAAQLDPTAAGLDVWSPYDIRHHLSTQACHWLAQMYNLIEDGAPWPTPFHQSNAVPIQKPDSDPALPLSFHVLTILPPPIPTLA